MEGFYRFYTNSDRASNEAKALEYLVNDKLDITPSNPAQFAKELEWYSMKPYLNTNNFIPGMFYTFKYNGTLAVTAGNNTFIDAIPLCLCIGSLGNYVLGFNFNLILNSTRARILDELYSLDPVFFEKELPAKLKKKEPAVSQVIGSLFINKERRNKFLSYISNKYKIPETSFVYRKYDKKLISNARLIDYYLWKWIPFLNFENSIRGANLRQIQLENSSFPQ